jgi:hypothetical protein
MYRKDREGSTLRAPFLRLTLLSLNRSLSLKMIFVVHLRSILLRTKKVSEDLAFKQVRPHHPGIAASALPTWRAFAGRFVEEENEAIGPCKQFKLGAGTT